MVKIKDRLNRAQAVVDYHKPMKNKNQKFSDRYLCWEIAVELFKRKIKEIGETFEGIDKKSYQSKRRYVNCFENFFEKSKGVIVNVSQAIAYFFRHLGGVVIHPGISLKDRVKAS